MQPVEAQKGVSTKSQLFHSLKVYLNNKNRLQPIIGLGSIIECVKAGTHNTEALYLCEVCVCRLSKADMQNHIMGSNHRYNYIKAWHPHLVSKWKENSDLSKVAWPLMDIAKTLEGKEGPGDIQLLEVGDAGYQKMATLTEVDAVNLVNILRNGQRQVEPESPSEQLHPTHCQRIALHTQNQQRWSEKSLKTSAEPSTSLWDNTQTSPELSVISKNSSSFFDTYTGTKPLIGLFDVVECRSEDGCTVCFLCHCCWTRTKKMGIICHLTSSSHIMKYLKATRPEQVEMMTDINDNDQLLQSLAKKVEQEEGRGELTVINAPERLCMLLPSKSYKWCVKRLWYGWGYRKFPKKKKKKKKMAVKGLSVNKTSNQGMPEKYGVVLSKWEKREEVSNTVFKVSMPIASGSVLLERTSFSMDRLPLSLAYSPSSGSDPIPAPESQSEDCETGPFAVNHAEHNSVCSNSQLQQDVYGGDADAGQYMRLGTNYTEYQELDGSFSDNQYFNQSEGITGTEDQMLNGEKNDNKQLGSQEGSTFCEGWQNECPQTQNEGLWPAVPHTQDWSSYYSSYGREGDCTEQWYNSAQVNTEERSMEMSSDAAQHYYQTQPQSQYIGMRQYESSDSQCGAAWFVW